MPRGKHNFTHIFLGKESVRSFNVDNFPKFIRNVETCGFRKLAGYKINLPFKAGDRKRFLTIGLFMVYSWLNKGE